MIFTALHEGFFTQIKVGLYLALFISLPIMLIQIWQYVSPGLYKDEKNIFLPFMIATPFLFLLSFFMVYFIVMPIAWNFFLSFEIPSTSMGLPIELEPRISEYLSLVLRLILAFGLCFQLPILILLLVRIGIINVLWLTRRRKYCILFSFITAAILTPPDVISQFLLAFPLILLYEISIIISKFMKKRDSD
jgi:sec-independent protein translocase protein TatC